MPLSRLRPPPGLELPRGTALYWFAPRPARSYRNLLLLGVGREDSTALAPHFRTFRKVGEITNPYARERGTSLYLGTAPDTAVIHRIYAGLHAEQAAWEGGLWQ